MCLCSMKKFILIFFLAGTSVARATTFISDGSSVGGPNSVQSLHDAPACQDGDTIVIPAGTFVWTSGVSITKGITLQGQTTVDVVAKTANDQTIFQDSDTRRGSGGIPFIEVTAAPGKNYRITGLTFDRGAATTQNYNGAIVLQGQGKNVRVDNTNWHANLDASPGVEANYITLAQAVCGVADHNIFKGTSGAASFHCYNGDTWPDRNGVVLSNGDGAFDSPTAFGGPDFFFIEDNVFDWSARTGNGNPGGGPDDLRGGRWVWRHNDMTNTAVQSHGTEDGRWHGGRAREIYNNAFHAPTVYGDGGIRSGVTLYYNNTWDGSQPGVSGYQLQTYRTAFKWPASPWGSATGDGVWDYNVTEADGVTHIDGHAPYTFVSGTFDAGTTNTHFVENDKTWTAHQWAGYSVKLTNGTQVGYVALILDNDAHSLTTSYYTDCGSGCHTWAAGDTYEIHKCLIAMDQPSRGQGDRIDFTTPINTVTGVAGWPHQALEPSYAWNNTYNGTQRSPFTVGTGGGGGLNGENAQLVQGRDYFQNTPMPGYTAYTYPHPLTGATPASTPTPTP
jgi:hypothetical protein